MPTIKSRMKSASTCALSVMTCSMADFTPLPTFQLDEIKLLLFPSWLACSSKPGLCVWRMAFLSLAARKCMFHCRLLAIHVPCPVGVNNLADRLYETGQGRVEPTRSDGLSNAGRLASKTSPAPSRPLQTTPQRGQRVLTNLPQAFEEASTTGSGIHTNDRQLSSTLAMGGYATHSL